MEFIKHENEFKEILKYFLMAEFYFKNNLLQIKIVWMKLNYLGIQKLN